MKKIIYFLLLVSFQNLIFAQAPTNGLVAYYPFNGNANDAVGTNHGAVNGATLTTDRKGNALNAYSFNGGSNYIQIPHSNTFNITGVITISVWINSNSISSQRIIDKTTVGGSDAWMADLRPNGQIRFIVANAGSNGQTQAQSDAVFTNNNQWYHFVVTYDNNNVRFYKDGLIINTKIQTGSSINNSNPLRFGANSLLNGDWFNGKLDDIRIYNRALTDTEVQQLYQAEAPPIDLNTGLVAYYKMDGNAQDASGNSNHGTAQNGVTFGTDRFGNAGKAASFDGVDDRITAPHSSSIYFTNSQPYTTSIWFKPISNTQSFMILKNANYGLQWRGITNTLGFYNGTYHYSTKNNWVLNQWYHITLIDNGTDKVSLYINGILDKADNQNPSRFGNYSLEMGKWEEPNQIFFNGSLDDIRIYDRALSDAEVLTLYGLENSGEIATIPITPSLTLNPTNPTLGSTITLNGSGFIPNSTATVSLTRDVPNFLQPNQTITVNSSGKFSAFYNNINDFGTYTAEAIDTQNNTASIKFSPSDGANNARIVKPFNGERIPQIITTGPYPFQLVWNDRITLTNSNTGTNNRTVTYLISY